MSLARDLLARLSWLRRSSTLRLSLLLSLMFALGMLVAILVALDLGEDAVLARFDETLEAIAEATVLDEAEKDSSAVIIRAPDNLQDLPRPFARAASRGGGTVMLERNHRGSDIWRILLSRDLEGTPIFLAVPLDDTADALELLSGILWGTVIFVVAATLAVGLAAGLLARRRLLRINDTLARLARGDLAARTGQGRSRDDLDDIAHQLDGAAGELERLVAQTRNLSASIAHDLRTPLARLRAQLEMLPEGEARGAALEEAARLSQIFDTIMRVARIEAAQGTAGFETVELGALGEELAEIFGPVIEDAGKTMKLRQGAAAKVQADRQMLIQAMANLIQNALVHGGDTVTLFADGHRIGVADNGSGVDPADFEEIVKPMVRLDAARTRDGSGLGLALVRAVADRHGAKLELAQNTPSGLKVALNFANL